MKNDFRDEKGYLLLSTLFLLMLSGVFTQGFVKVASSQLIQLKQVSTAYQAKSALRMSETLLKKYIEDNEYNLPETGVITTSIGEVIVEKISEQTYRSTIVVGHGFPFSSELTIVIPEIETDEIEVELIDEEESSEELSEKPSEIDQNETGGDNPETDETEFDKEREQESKSHEFEERDSGEDGEKESDDEENESNGN